MGGADPEEFLAVTLGEADRLHALARRLTLTAEEGEDLVQETYLHAWRAWQRGRPVTIGPWLATICLNLARSAARRRSSRPRERLDPGAGREQVDPADPADAAVARVEADRVHLALHRLPVEQREAVVLMDLCGWTAAEVADLLGLPRGTVLSRTHRGHKALARLLGAEVSRGATRP